MHVSKLYCGDSVHLVSVPVKHSSACVARNGPTGLFQARAQLVYKNIAYNGSKENNSSFLIIYSTKYAEQYYRLVHKVSALCGMNSLLKRSAIARDSKGITQFYTCHCHPLMNHTCLCCCSRRESPPFD